MDESAITLTGKGFLQDSLAWVPRILSHTVGTNIEVSLSFSRHPTYYTPFLCICHELKHVLVQSQPSFQRQDHSITSLGNRYFKNHFNITAAAWSKSSHFLIASSEVLIWKFIESITTGKHFLWRFEFPPFLCDRLGRGPGSIVVSTKIGTSWLATITPAANN